MIGKTWSYDELTKQAEKTIAEDMDSAAALPEGDEGRVQYVAWAFGAWKLWFDLAARCDEFRSSDDTRLRNLLDALRFPD